MPYFMHNAIINFALAYQLNPWQFLVSVHLFVILCKCKCDRALVCSPVEMRRRHSEWVSECECACKTSGFGQFLTLLSSVCYLSVFIAQNSVHKTAFGKQRKRWIEVNGRHNMRKTFLLSFSTFRMGIFICCVYFVSIAVRLPFFLSSIWS